MARIRNLAAPDQAQRNEWRSRRGERSTDLQAASVSDGELTINGEEALVVVGSQVVRGVLIIQGPDGELRIDGEINGDGTFTWTGGAVFNGPVEITETLDVSAETTLRAALSLLADLKVGTGGKITAGDLTITPSGEIKSTTNLVITAPTTRFAGSVVIAGGNSFTVPLVYKAGVTANVHIDTAGRLWKTTP